jgi:hypothetical protein
VSWCNVVLPKRIRRGLTTHSEASSIRLAPPSSPTQPTPTPSASSIRPMSRLHHSPSLGHVRCFATITQPAPSTPTLPWPLNSSQPCLARYPDTSSCGTSDSRPSAPLTTRCDCCAMLHQTGQANPEIERRPRRIHCVWSPVVSPEQLYCSPDPPGESSCALWLWRH